MRLSQELAGPRTERIMDACEPRGENFKPVRQFGCRYAFVRELPTEEYMQSHATWDRDQVLLAGFTLSRLILDNVHSTEYAARVVEFSDDDVQIIPGPVNQEGALVYRARSGRDWLDAGEAAELATLLDSFWQRDGQLGERVTNAIWLAEQSARRRYDFEALLTVISGLEALINTGPNQNTRSSSSGCPTSPTRSESAAFRAAWRAGSTTTAPNPPTAGGSRSSPARAPASLPSTTTSEHRRPSRNSR